uniref:Protein c-Fos n=1 Tax=Myripristis murdjan TaxID=586833 RepID=A0A668AQ54_9TELE
NMHPDSNPEYDSSSSCSTASPGGDTPGCSQHPPDSLCSSSAADSFVPTVTAISSSPDLRWMVQPTVITSVSPSSSRAKPKPKMRVHVAPSKEEEERKRIRRERNKIAAAKCRNRRRELTDTLQAETDKLEEEKAALQTEIADLLKEKERLEQILVSHKPSCKLPNDDEEEEEDDVDTIPITQEMDSVPCISAAAILGNSNILLCASAEEEPLEDLKGDDLDDLVPSLEMAVAAETAASVPDIDLGGPFCVSDWETLYKSVANDLESLSTPVMSSSPTCSNLRTVFSFNYSEIDSLAEGCESLKGGLGASEFMKDSLNSPTLLAL